MKKLLSHLISILILVVLILSVNHSAILAETPEEESQRLEEEKQQLEREQQEREGAAEEVLEETGTVKQNLDATASNLYQTEGELAVKDGELIDLDQDRLATEEALTQKEALRQLLIRNIYKRSQVSTFELFLASGGFSSFARVFGQQLAFLGASRQDLETLSGELGVLLVSLAETQDKKEHLEGEVAGLENKKQSLVVEKSNLEAQYEEIQTEITDIAREIAGITARQQQLLAEKLGSFSTSVGEVPPSDDNPSPHFGERPAFAVYSFGAPHRVGMSQYGAFGRAKAGQDYRAILGAYYNDVRIEKRDNLPGDLEVYGYGRISFEDNYLRGIAEMPTKWADEGGFEALKAQAVAARSYAMAATGMGASGICSGEACQVYRPSKAADGAAARWHQAVAETRGEVMLSNETGEVIAAWYSSTTGGFTRSSADVWGKYRSWTLGIRDVAEGGSWPDDAYEGAKYGASPWFYKAWYHPRSVSPSRPSAWLTQSEFVDILNCLWLYTLDNGAVTHLSQLDKPNEDTWSSEKVREALRARGGDPINSVSEVPAPSFSNAGFTVSLSFVTDKGLKTFSGADFKSVFNLRSPGELFVASSLFNIERQ